MKLSLILLLLIPTAGVKESLFLLPGCIYFYEQFRSSFTKKVLIYSGLSAAALLVWLVALNLNAIFYFENTYQNVSYLARYTTSVYIAESSLLIGSMIACFYFLKQKRHIALCLISITFLATFFLIPQSFDFFAASITPFIYLPLFILILLKLGEKQKISIIILQFCFVATYRYSLDIQFYPTNITQLKYISLASHIVHENKLTYLDGMGILPKQNYIPCFVSPLDEESNHYCLKLIENRSPDVIIVTNRLLGLGDKVFELTKDRYTQIYPNFYVSNDFITNDMIRNKDLSDKNGVPVFLF